MEESLQHGRVAVRSWTRLDSSVRPERETVVASLGFGGGKYGRSRQHSLYSCGLAVLARKTFHTRYKDMEQLWPVQVVWAWLGIGMAVGCLE